MVVWCGCDDDHPKHSKKRLLKKLSPASTSRAPLSRSQSPGAACSCAARAAAPRPADGGLGEYAGPCTKRRRGTNPCEKAASRTTETKGAKGKTHLRVGLEDALQQVVLALDLKAVERDVLALKRAVGERLGQALAGRALRADVARDLADLVGQQVPVIMQFKGVHLARRAGEADLSQALGAGEAPALRRLLLDLFAFRCCCVLRCGVCE